MAINGVTPQWPAFLTRLRALPAVNDTCDLAVHLYQRSKEYRMVGVALGMAEYSVKTVVMAATPLAAPLSKYEEHLKPLDEWACRKLDTVERMVPVVTKPTGEVLSATREGVLGIVAGGDKPQPSSLAAAVCSRTARLVEQAEVIKDKTVGAGSAPHRVLDAAHDMLDQYLPEGGHPQEPDVRERGVGVKTAALATKTTRRLCHAAHERIHASCPLDPTPSHVAMECIHLACNKWRVVAGEEVQERQLIVPLLVFSIRLYGNLLNLLLVSMVFLFKQVYAAHMKMNRAALLSQDRKPHDK